MRISDWSSDVCSSDLSGLSFEACCGPILAGTPALTALALMRSRYTAYARGDVAHLARTLAPEHRAGFDAADVSAGMQTTQWLGLEILDKIGRAHVRTPVTNAHLVCSLLLDKNKD